MLSRFQQIAALLALLLGIVVCSRAQDVRQEQRLVSKEEGQAIAHAALEHWPQVHDKPDCSHLVHDVYGEAGLDYEYAPTGDIFEGIDPFRRVHAPQPGDLVVWQGHVGIVIDPEDTSFYSSVISGFSVSSFTSSYWLSRGPQRFYRYMINGLQSARLLDLFGVHKPRATPAIGSATYEPKYIVDGDASDRDGSNTVPAPSKRAAGGSPVTENRALDGTVSTTRTTVLGVRATDSLGRERPTKEAIRSAFVQFSDSTAQGLQQSGFLSSAVEIVESFELGRFETQGLSGWAEFKIRKMASFADGRMKLTATAAPETVRFRLLRQAEGWTLVDSAKRVYLLRQAAISMITGRLADLSKTRDNEDELKPLTKALGILLAEDRSRGERATTELRPH